jgi:cell division transport system permease protein
VIIDKRYPEIFHDMTKKRSNRISTFGSHITSIISVALVLLILGLIAIGGLAGQRITNDIRSNIGFVIKAKYGATDVDVNNLKKQLSNAKYIESYVYSSAEEIRAQESESLGEDISLLLDENPFTAEFDVKVKPAYANGDSIEALRTELEKSDLVSEVLIETTVIDDVNTAISRFTMILLVVAGALLIISFALINNTVSLSIYSRRFVIHTMKLVGATRGFIRRPFISAGIYNGVISAIIACACLAAMCYYALTLDPVLNNVVTWEDMGFIFLCIITAGIIICAIASLIATNRYLHADYDDMFMK